MTWAISVPILIFLGLSVLDLGPMYVTDRRQTDVRQHHRLMPPGRGIITLALNLLAYDIVAGIYLRLRLMQFLVVTIDCHRNYDI